MSGGKVVNLRRARKRRERAERAAQADASAARHGLDKNARDLDAARKRKMQRDLDGHRRDKE